MGRGVSREQAAAPAPARAFHHLHPPARSQPQAVLVEQGCPVRLRPPSPERRQRPALCSLPRSGACSPPAPPRLRLSLSAERIPVADSRGVLQECMRVAQSLYEAGWITYMRTDNPTLSEAAKAKARQCVQQLYGADNLGSETRAIKKPKGSQEAHEPIRPALTDDPNAPGGFNIKPPLQGMQLRLYDMILARTLASVMTDAVLDLTSVQVSARSGGDGDAAKTTEPALAVFRASGMVVRNPGWMRAYQEGSDGSLSASPSANGKRSDVICQFREHARRHR